MCGRAQPTPTCCRHRGRCRFTGALSHVRLSYKRFSSFYSHVGRVAADRRRPMLLLLYWRREDRKTHGRQTGFLDNNGTATGKLIARSVPPPPLIPRVRWVHVRSVGWTQRVYANACWALRVHGFRKTRVVRLLYRINSV